MSANQNPLGPDHRRLPDRVARDLGRNRVDGVAARLPAGARPALVRTAGLPIYYPPVFFWWWYVYDAYAPQVFVEGAYIAASGSFISIAVAIGMSVWRAREAKNVETYGSARWADAREVKAAGLLGPDGVVLGKLDRDYLRHDGPEHVLCFAPTRSGKGVGLVVPSLLTWPGSAIVHDIKGENWQLTAGFRSQHGRVLLFDPTNAKSVRLQSAAGGSPRRMGGARRPERRRRAGRPGGLARQAEPLGEDQPLTAGRRHPACPLCRGGQDTWPASPPSSPIRSGRSRRRCKAMMTTPHLGETGRASRRRLDRARAAEQVRQ